MEAPHGAAPVVSVVVSATHDSETLVALVERLVPQVEHFGVELLIADGSVRGLRSIPDVEIALHRPGAGAFTLRAEAARIARGRIVAFADAHTLPERGWLEAVIRAHDEHPHAPVIAGAIANGSTATTLDWASYLTVLAPFMPPLPGRVRRAPPPVNLAIHRDALAAHDLEPGFIETRLVPHLWRAGLVVADDRIRLAHVRSCALRECLAAHIHDARARAGLPRQPSTPRGAVAGVASALALVPRIVALGVGEPLRRRRHRREALRAAPLVLVLACARAAGHALGALFGPGRGPELLEGAGDR